MTPSASSPIKVVCFDLGGVIVRICRSWEEGCRAAGVDMRCEAGNDPEGTAEARAASHLHQTGKMHFQAFLQRVVDSRGNRYTIDEARRIHSAWLLGEYPRVCDVIDRIHQAGLVTAALSNTNQAHWEAMADFPSLRKLKHRLASHELGLAKPDITIYKEAERRMGATGESILFFDDLAENIAGARLAGWNAVQIDHTGDTAKQIRSALESRSLV